MIEQVHGSGLSGIAGKTGKGTKNGLFSKLLLMLEQHSNLTGKGQSLHHGKVGKTSALSEKADSFLTAKSKHILALTKKDKHHIKSQADDKAIPLLAAHIFADAALHSKKTVKAGSTLLAVHLKGEKQTVAGKLPVQSAGTVVASLMDKHTAANDKAEKTTRSVLNDGKLSSVITGKFGSDIGQTGHAEKATIKHVQQSTSEVGVKTGAAEKATIKHVQQSTSEAGVKTGIAEKPQATFASDAAGIKPNAIIGQGQLVTEQSFDEHLFGNQATNIIDKKSYALAEKSGIQAGSASGNAIASRLGQKNKAVQLQHIQVVTSNSAAASAGLTISTPADASLADSGSHFSDKGNQDGRYISTLGSEAKTDVRVESTHTHFQQHLSAKAIPSMTLFDSMNHIAQSASKGKTKLEIQLDPANLGKIQISLQSDASKQLQVHMIVDQSTTRAALEQQLPQLKSALAQQGFDLSGFSMGSQGQQKFSDHNNRGSSHQFATAADHDIDTIPVNRMPVSGTGLSIRV